MGMSPASLAPCTLFWPRSGCRPEPGLPIWPVTAQSAMRQRALSVPCTCWLTPMPQRIIDAFAVAKARATSRSVSAGMPQTGAMASGLQPITLALSASKLLARSWMKASSTSPSSITVWMSALSMATSVSALNCSVRQAWRPMSVTRGSASTIFAPRFAAFFIQVAATGWLAVGLEPITKISSACSTSFTGLLTAPEPTPSSSAATLDAWHSRVQWSTLLLPKPVRTSFWNR